MRKTKIIATLGPSLSEYDALIKAFSVADVARFNLSHGSYDEHKKRFKLMREVEEELKKPITLMADTKGPEIRTTNKKDIVVKKGEKLNLIDDVGITFAEVLIGVPAGTKIYIDDGAIKAVTVDEKLTIEFLNDGVITPKRKVSFPGYPVPIPDLTEQDYRDFQFIAEMEFDIVAQSFVRTVESVKKAKDYFDSLGYNPPIIAKIETKKGVYNAERILKVADGLMVARGDLATEFAYEEVPIAQRELVRLARMHSRPVIIATQMLESMVNSPSPTRAEVNDVATAVYMQADAVMLSSETSKGKYPIEAIITMKKIIERVETELESEPLKPLPEYKNIFAYHAVQLANSLDAPLLAPTMHGTTPRKVSSLRPKQEIYAFTPVKKTYKYLNLCYGVRPILMEYEPILQNAEKLKKMAGVEKAVFIFGYPPGNHKTNVIAYL